MMVLLIDCLTCSSMANSQNGKMTSYRHRCDVNHVASTLIGRHVRLGFDFFNNIPAGVGRQNYVVLTSMRRDDVALMPI